MAEEMIVSKLKAVGAVYLRGIGYHVIGAALVVALLDKTASQHRGNVLDEQSETFLDMLDEHVVRDGRSHVAAVQMGRQLATCSAAHRSYDQGRLTTTD